MEQALLFLVLTCFLGGCATTVEQNLDVKPPKDFVASTQHNLENLPLLDAPPMTIAVYEFKDLTGQRKPSQRFSQLSTAVTQGADSWVIDALQCAANGDWFTVIERGGLNNLVKERQLVRNTREIYEKKLAEGPTPLKPMVFAGLILEGGIIGYDSNVAIGGAGARYLGVGAQTEYRVDTVTVVMRIVSVSTGKVLLSIATEKTIASSRSGADVFKFLDMGTKLIESETGYSVNEPVNYAVRAAIEAGVVQLVYEGEKEGLWKFKEVSTKYKGEVPKLRPLPMQDALKKWPKARLYCSEKDLCWPIEAEEKIITKTTICIILFLNF